jgi:hypothetical protein
VSGAIHLAHPPLPRKRISCRSAGPRGRPGSPARSAPPLLPPTPRKPFRLRVRQQRLNLPRSASSCPHAAATNAARSRASRSSAASHSSSTRRRRSGPVTALSLRAHAATRASPVASRV